MLVINRLIKQKNINKDEFCNKIGISKRTLYNYMQKNSSIPHDVLIKIAQELDTDIFTLLKDEFNLESKKHIVEETNDDYIIQNTKENILRVALESCQEKNALLNQQIGELTYQVKLLKSQLNEHSNNNN